MAVVVIDTIKPKNQGTFPVVEATDVKVNNDKRLDAALNEKANASTVEALSTAVAGKASQSDVTALQTAVAGKASQSDLTALSNTVADKADKSALAETNTAIAGKADAADLTALSAVVGEKAEASELVTATTNLQGQIDQIVISSAAESVVAPEVAAARVSADGVEYTTLKNRLDESDNTNAHKFDIIANKSRNLFTGTFKAFSNLNNSTGVYSVSGSNTNTVASEEFIAITAGTTYYFSSPDTKAEGASYSFFWYDTNKNFLSSSSGLAPNNAAFVRIKINKSNSSETLSTVKKWQMETGGITEYISPYQVTSDTIENNSISTSKIVSKAISPDKTTFIEKTINIFNYDAIRIGYAINSTTGAVSDVSDNSYLCTDEFIEVEASTNYTISKSLPGAVLYGFVYEYSSNGSYIQRTSVQDGQTIQTDSSTKYIRIQENAADVDFNDEIDSFMYQIEKGSVQHEYVNPYVIDDRYIAKINSDQIADSSITPEKTSFINPTINIFDYSSLEAGYAIGQNNGAIVQSTSNYISTLSFIPVDSSETYTISKSVDGIEPYGFIYEYDSTYAYIGRTNVVNGSVITMGSTTKYIRIQEDIHSSDISTFRYQIERGTVQHQYTNPEVVDKLLMPVIELNMLSSEVQEMIVEAPDPLADIKDALDEKRPAIIKRNSTELLNFGFCTDTHLEDVGGNQTGLLDIQTINQLASENWLDFVVHGGDVFNSYLTGSQTGSQGITFDVALERLDDAMSHFDNVKCPLFVARGNHDLNDKYMPDYPDDTTVDHTQQISQAQFKLLCQSKFRGSVNGEYHCSFFKDFDDKKIRVIVVDVFVNDTQASNFNHDSLSFLANAMDLGTKTDYSVIIFAHTFGGASTNIITSLITAFKTGSTFTDDALNVTKDFTSQGAGDFIACICGHSHSESYTAENGYGYITSNTSYLKTDSDVKNNIYANVYTIDKTNKILYKQKLGENGQSLSFNWNTLTFTEI